MGFTKANESSKLCKYPNCVMLARSGYTGNFWCAWHADNRFKSWVDVQSEFIAWRDSQRESGSYPFDYGHIEYYIHDETIWSAIRGQITASQLLEAFEAKRVELQSLINQEVQDFCQEHKLKTKQDMLDFCRGNFNNIASPLKPSPIETRDLEAITQKTLAKYSDKRGPAEK